MRFTYSRAQRYGSNAKMLARAHFCRSKGDFLEAIARLLRCRLSELCYDSMFKVSLVGNILFGWRGAAPAISVESSPQGIYQVEWAILLDIVTAGGFIIGMFP
jgi:hypothetical protein